MVIPLGGGEQQEVLPIPVERLQSWHGYCIRCGDISTWQGQPLEIPTLCEPCRLNWWEKAESYGGTRDEIMARVSGWIKEAENGKTVH